MSALIETLLTVATVAVTALGAMVTYLIRRRSSTGKISTSEAATLWQQSQDMRAMLLSEKHKVEEQRDKMIDLQMESVIPSLKFLGETMESMNRIIEDTLNLLEDRTRYFEHMQKDLDIILVQTGGSPRAANTGNG